MNFSDNGDTELEPASASAAEPSPADTGSGQRTPVVQAQSPPAGELTPREVGEFFTALDKAVRARRLYAANNPAYKAFVANLRTNVTALWDGAHALTVVVDESGFRWHDETFSPGEGREHLAFQFYKDGIRALTFLPGFEQEIERFLDVVARARQIDSTSADDMVTLLWEQEFASLLYNYVDALVEGLEIPETGPIPIPFDKLDLTLVSADVTGSDESATTLPPAVQAGMPTVAQTISRDDFEETLYFLEHGELEYLRQEVER
ncbi:MAG TPA: hypothetical protein VFY80_05040, partial [Burkholderiales bacterium]|nr:hypothetical protein [Burkholderiales bacterium]